MNSRCGRCDGFLEELCFGETRCVNCGNRTYGPLPVRKEVSKADFRSKYTPHNLKNGKKYAPCPVLGCNRIMEAGREMCARCTQALAIYHRTTNHVTSPPIQKNADGVWYIVRGRKQAA